MHPRLAYRDGVGRLDTHLECGVLRRYLSVSNILCPDRKPERAVAASHDVTRDKGGARVNKGLKTKQTGETKNLPGKSWILSSVIQKFLT